MDDSIRNSLVSCQPTLVATSCRTCFGIPKKDETLKQVQGDKPSTVKR